MSAFLSETRMAWVAHRGASADRPENTMAAFEEAVRQGADAIELDVRLSRDGEVVVIHDATLARTAGADGHVWERSADELARLDAGGWFDPRFRGEPVPRLADVLARIAPRVPINVELKGKAGAGLARAVVDLVRSAEARERVLVSSFRFAHLDELRALDAELPIGLLYEEPPVTLDADARRVGASFVHPRFDLATPALVARARTLGLRVLVWTVDDPTVANELIDRGVDGIISNRVAELRARCAQSAAG
ncbi:MAG: glycerophosphodiester phosphodiesterase family protein [bacterium]